MCKHVQTENDEKKRLYIIKRMNGIETRYKKATTTSTAIDYDDRECDIKMTKNANKCGEV